MTGTFSRRSVLSLLKYLRVEFMRGNALTLMVDNLDVPGENTLARGITRSLPQIAIIRVIQCCKNAKEIRYNLFRGHL